MSSKNPVSLIFCLFLVNAPRMLAHGCNFALTGKSQHPHDAIPATQRKKSTVKARTTFTAFTRNA